MLIEFTVANYRSFKDKATLSLVAGTDTWLEEDNVAVVRGERFLKAAGIYGANASGKSNFLAAMVTFRDFILESATDRKAGEEIPVTPFRLHADTASAPTFFQIIFVQNHIRYRYGFEVDQEKVRTEWLFKQEDSIRETRLFTREVGSIDFSATEFKEAKDLEQRTRPDALFLSVAAQWNSPTAIEVRTWMVKLLSISGLNDHFYESTLAKLNEDEFRQEVVQLLKKADVGIADIKMERMFDEDFFEGLGMTEDVKKVLLDIDPSLKLYHSKFGANQNPLGVIGFDWDDESEGTKKFIALCGPFLNSFHMGSVLVIDEFEARLHPLLTKALISLFNSSANKKNAQLIFATHDTGILDPKVMRRDQIWFVEKDQYGASQLYSLAEIKGVRKEANFEREYLLGQFGAVPHVGDFTEGLNELLQKQ